MDVLFDRIAAIGAFRWSQLAFLLLPHPGLRGLAHAGNESINTFVKACQRPIDLNTQTIQKGAARWQDRKNTFRSRASSLLASCV